MPINPNFLNAISRKSGTKSTSLEWEYEMSFYRWEMQWPVSMKVQMLVSMEIN